MSFIIDEEISSQPGCWRQAEELAASVVDLMPPDGERVAFVGCGTSWYMGQVMAALRERAGRGETDAFTASEFPRERRYDKVIALSRSGLTTEVLDLLYDIQGKVPTLSFVGDTAAPIAELSDAAVDLAFADEAALVQSRFATSAVALWRSWLGHDMDRVIADAEEVLDFRLPEAFVGCEQVTYLGSRWTIGLAREAALKFRGASLGWAESYPAMEYRHGAIAIAEENRAVWMLGDAPRGLAAEVAATGAMFIDYDWDPMAELILTQRLALARGMRLGLNVDNPRHMNRSIVLESE